MDSDSSSSDKSDRVQEVLAACLSRRALGEQLSDQAILSEHADLRPELEIALQKMRFIDAAFDACEQVSTHRAGLAKAEESTLSRIGVRCPACKSLVDAAHAESLAEVTCANCDTTFRLAVDEPLGADDLTGTMVGHFQLLSLLGQGAFGSVWRAHDSELDREVAVKLPRSGRLTEEESAMFLREARAAAQLAHPNIVSIHEVGRDHKRLYIVSDLIEGETLAERMKWSGLSVHEAALMCRTIALALHSAHQAGVIHRDLKPSNILLDLFDEPHVGDFGLTKRNAGELTMTGTGQMLGTPAYMSPEQALGESHQADARSDVYALGVILFELLTGETPFRGTPQMLFVQILQDEPPRPRRLNGLIPKDLETICLKCLEKQPERRYASAELLADDLDRWIQTRPITARPLSSFGRAARWSQRRPVVASLAATVAVVTLVGLAGVTWQWRATKAALVREQHQRARADENLRAAGDVVADFLAGVANLRLINEPRVEELRNELLTKATEYYETIASSNADDPLLRFEAAKAQRSLAHLKGDFGDVAAGVRHANSALELLRGLDGEEAVDQVMRQAESAAALITRGRLRWSVAMDYQEGAAPAEDFAEAHRLLQDALSQQPSNMKWLRQDADALAKLGSLYRATNHAETIPTIEQALAVWQRIVDAEPDQPNHYDHLGRSHLDLALLDLVQGPYERALQHAHQAYQLQEQGLAIKADFWPCRSTRALSLAMMARAHKALGNLDAAADAFRQAIEARQVIADAFPESVYHRNDLANQVYRLAELRVLQEMPGAARTLIECAIELREELREQLPDNRAMSRYLVGARMILCDVLMLEGRHGEALAVAETAIRDLGNDAPGQMSDYNKACAYRRAASAHLVLGAFDKAQESCNGGLSLLEPLFEAQPTNLSRGDLLLSLRWLRVKILQRAGDVERAIAATPTVLELARELNSRFTHDPNTVDRLAQCLVAIGELHQQVGDWSEAEDRFCEAVAVQPLKHANADETNAITATSDLLVQHLRESRIDEAVALIGRMADASEEANALMNAAAIVSKTLASVADDPELLSTLPENFLTDNAKLAAELCERASLNEETRLAIEQLDAFHYLRETSGASDQ